MELSAEERKILEIVRGMDYGDLVVFMKDGQPQRVEVRHSILLKEKEK